MELREPTLETPRPAAAEAGTAAGVEHFMERQQLGLYTDDEYREAMEGAGLHVRHDPVGLRGRGLWVGRRR